MSAFPGSPSVTRGAIVQIDPFNPLAGVIVFQYNPEKMTRSLTGRFTGGHEGNFESAGPATSVARPLRIVGPPTETISLEVAINAIDQLERGDGFTQAVGIYPQLSALEMLLYPKTAQVAANAVLARLGLIKVQNPEAPLTLLIWGLQRVVPVRVTSFSITEEMYDPSLNPIHATVQLGLTVLNYEDLGLLSTGGAIFMAHQIVKEVMATIAGVGAVTNALGI